MLLRKRSHKRRGIVLVLVAFSLVAIIGMVALSVDGGVLQLKYREARANADAAAMAAACVLFEDFPKNKGKDPDGRAHDAAVSNAKANGINDDGVTSKIDVHIPPITGIYAGQDSYCEVYVTYYVPRAFSRIFGTEPVTVKTRAVSRGAWVGTKIGVLILDYDDKASLNAQGNGAFTEVGASVIVNSNNPGATVVAGNGTMKADEFFITGGLALSGNGGMQSYPEPGKIYTGMHPTPDPLAYLPVPPVPPDGKMIVKNLGNGNKEYTLTPGRYTNLPNFNTGDVVIFNQASTNSNGGIYYIDGGGFHSTGATLKMGTGTGGIMLYNSPTSQAQSQKIQITGNPAGEVILSGLDSGPYRGIALWQDRTSDVDILVEGNGNFNIYGTFYAAGAKLNINGNGKTDGGDITSWFIDANGNKVEGSRIATQYISRNLSLGGNGNIHMNYTEQGTAKTRIIALVE